MKTKHAFIAAHASGHAIRFMCRVLGVAHSWFHARRRAAPKRAERAARRDRLGSEIREIFEQSKRCYGAPRIHAELKARGLRISKRTVAKLMRENGIRPPRAYRRGYTGISGRVLARTPRRNRCPEPNKLLTPCRVRSTWRMQLAPSRPIRARY